MIPLDNERWSDECDAFVRRFAERAARWDEQQGDLEDRPIEPWRDPDHPDERLDAAYRSGIVPPALRGADDAWDHITVLRAHGRRLAKRIGRDGSIEGYDSPRIFDMTEIPIDGIGHLEEDLRRLLHQPEQCVIRGAIADLGRATGVRRLLHADGDDPATLVEVPRRWVALDIDSLPISGGVVVEDISACAKVAAAALPAEFHSARCIAQFTASHSFKPGLRLRLWYWFNRPVWAGELKRWLAASPVDHAPFGPAQIIYTSAPIFAGRTDPLPHRMIRMPGRAQVAVPELPKPTPQPVAKPIKPEIGLSRYAESALDAACRNILAAPAGEQEATINSEAFSIGTLAGANAIPGDFARRALVWAAHQIRDYDPQRPWRAFDLDHKVNRAFDDWLCHPRAVRHA
jgi:hypothetical protein